MGKAGAAGLALLLAAAYVGTTPIRAVDSPMPLKVIRNVYFRPTISPTRPNTSAPSGRIKKPIVNSATVLSRPATGCDFSKNFTARMEVRLQAWSGV